MMFSYCPKCDAQTEFERISSQLFRCKKCGAEYVGQVKDKLGEVLPSGRRETQHV